MKPILHHFAFNIRPNTLEVVMELMEKMGCITSYRESDARWCMIEQKPIPIDIQIIETEDEVVSTDKK